MLIVVTAPVKRKAWLQGELNSQLLFGEAVQVRSHHDEEIIHIGILLGDELIIHATGKVRIDNIGKKGIFNNEQVMNSFFKDY